MKSLFLSISFLLAAIVATAQQLHFVYLQTDNRKPFYALLNGKNYSSSSIGYVILPKLQNGDYTIRIGFPRNEQPEQEFLVQVRNNDQGFLIKDFGDKGWGLFNLQSLDIQYAGTTAEKRNQLAAQQKAAEEKQKQEAAAMAAQHRADSLQAITQAQQKAQAEAEAAQAALRQQRYNDSVQAATATASLRQQQQAAERRKQDSLQKENEIALTNNKKTKEAAEQRRITDSLQKAVDIAVQSAAQQVREEEAQRRITDSLQRIADAAARQQQQQDELQQKAQATKMENERLERLADSTAKAQPAAIERAKQNAAGVSQTGGPVLLQKTFTDSGWRYSYTVSSGDKKETVDVFIPVGQSQPAVVATPVTTPEVQPANTPVQQPATTTTQPETKKEDTKFLNMEFGSNTVVKTDSATPGVKVMHNSNCRAAADEKDFLATRRKIVAANETDMMIAMARKLMKEKCYTTEQIRNLSFLFLTDADRYQFLDAAYPFALDAYRFGSLQDVLKDDYYIQRFKAMLR